MTVPQTGAARWVADWVTALAEAGRPRPTEKAKELFGSKCKTIPDIDPAIMSDCIRRMVDEDKGPALAALIYGDCERATEQELWNLSVGGRGRV